MDEELVKNIGYFAFVAIWALINLTQRLKKAKAERAAREAQGRPGLATGSDEAPQTTLDRPLESRNTTSKKRRPATTPSIFATQAKKPRTRAVDDDRVRKLLERAEILARDFRVSAATRPFSEPLEEYAVKRAKALRFSLRRSELSEQQARVEFKNLRIVVKAMDRFAKERQQPGLRRELGDADAMARACYAPFMQFAHSRGLPLSTAQPVTHFGAGDLATWTGFLPTGLAPISLPHAFFENIYWWPALAHEIAHDVMACTPTLEPTLRAQFGLVPQHVGLTPFIPHQSGLSMDQARALLGGWFEEIFCDIFGTLMLGSAYGTSMLKLFSSPGNRERIVTVMPNGQAYDEHPPRHLRFVLVTHLLARIGHEEEANKLRAEWSELHGGWPQVVFMPWTNGYTAVQDANLVAATLQLVDGLLNESLHALGGFHFRDVPGVDFGLHASAEVRRMTRELIRGQIPHKSDARWVVAAAVEATAKHPEKAERFMTLARRAINAVGTFEHAADAYGGLTEAPASKYGKLREAMLLHVIMGPPRSLEKARRKTSPLARRR